MVLKHLPGVTGLEMDRGSQCFDYSKDESSECGEHTCRLCVSKRGGRVQRIKMDVGPVNDMKCDVSYEASKVAYVIRLESYSEISHQST